MKKNGIKILMAMESVVYFIIAAIILSIVFQMRYICINSWSGLLLWGGLGILCPLLASIIGNIFIRSEKKRVGKILSYILIPYVLVSCISIFCFEFGGIICSSTQNTNNYLEFDERAEWILRSYGRVLPDEKEDGLRIQEYGYKFVTTFDDNCDIYIKTEYENTQQLEEKLSFFEEKLGMNAENLTDSTGTYRYGECVINYNIGEKQIEYELKL